MGPQAEERAGAYAVIGAGMSGLASLKALREAGFDADCYERESEVGGNWNIDARNSRIYRSIHLISSRPFTQYPDFPMPDSFADYPAHTEVLGYFKRYADHFGLREHIAFDHDVLRVEPVDGGARWDVTAEGPDGVARTRRYDGVLIANGHNWSPKMPTYEGLDAFGGAVLHSKDYKDSDVLRGKRVLIVGGGNTGCDLAVEGAQNAAATYHSTRRGYYYNPKFVGGRPSDQVNDTLLLLRIPLAVRRLMYKATLRATVGSFDKLGLQKPDHEFGETHPVANSLLAYYLGHGDIQPKPEIRRFTAEGVEFTDGTSADVDVVVFCTGYVATFPFLDDEHLNTADGRPRLYQHEFTPRHDNLFVVGLHQPDSGTFCLSHWQAVAAVRYLEARRDRPDAARAFRARVAAETDRRFTGGMRFTDSTRHYFEIAHQDFLAGVEQTIHQLEGAR